MGNHPARSRLALVVALVLLCSTLSFGVAAQSQYSLTVDGGIDTPDKTVTIEGQSFDVSETVRVEPGEEIAVETSGPTDEQYRVNLLNKKNQIAASNNTLSGAESFSFETEGLNPGSYVVAVYGADGNYKTIQPVVISGYDVSADVDNTVEEDSESTITVEVDPKQNAPELESVKVMISNDDEDDFQTLTASESSDGTYTATTTFETSGEFDVFATVRGTDTFNGEQEILGISDVQSVIVDDDSSDSSGSGDSSDGSDSDTSTMTTTATKTATTTQPAETYEATDASPTDSSETTESAQTPAPTTTDTTSPLHAVQLLLFVLVVVGSAYQLRK